MQRTPEPPPPPPAQAQACGTSELPMAVHLARHAAQLARAAEAHGQAVAAHGALRTEHGCGRAGRQPGLTRAPRPVPGRAAFCNVTVSGARATAVLTARPPPPAPGVGYFRGCTAAALANRAVSQTAAGTWGAHGPVPTPTAPAQHSTAQHSTAPAFVQHLAVALGATRHSPAKVEPDAALSPGAFRSRDVTTWLSRPWPKATCDLAGPGGHGRPCPQPWLWITLRAVIVAAGKRSR